jgi:hypothetical protein
VFLESQRILKEGDSMKDLKTLGRTTWDKIEVGEVFAETCGGELEYIQIKINTSLMLCLAQCRSRSLIDLTGGESNPAIGSCGDFYKLPPSVQKLWGEK